MRASADVFNDLASFQAATGSLQLIDFDTDTLGNPTVDGTQIGATYSPLGVTFTAGNVFEAGFSDPVSDPTGWLNDTFVGSDIVFDADFTIPGVTAVGVHNVGNAGLPQGSVLRAFDSLSSLLETVTSDADGGTLDFFGVTTSTDIARITITVPNAIGWGLDDLYFGSAGATAVPEPGVLAFLAGPVLLAAYGTRRRRLANSRG
jgi:hypothetical protein